MAICQAEFTIYNLQSTKFMSRRADARSISMANAIAVAPRFKARAQAEEYATHTLTGESPPNWKAPQGGAKV